MGLKLTLAVCKHYLQGAKDFVSSTLLCIVPGHAAVHRLIVFVVTCVLQHRPWLASPLAPIWLSV